jgi:fatty-acyl-CoA synthase
MFLSMFAAFRLGAIWVPTNFRVKPEELLHMVEVSGSTVFLCQTDFPEHAETVSKHFPQMDLLWLRGTPAPADSRPLVADLLRDHAGAVTPNADVFSNTPCWLLFTSGTTGKPKAAVLTHGQMAFVLTNHLADLLPGTRSEDGGLVLAPLSHGAGVHQLNLVLRGAKTVLLPGDSFSTEQAFALIEKYKLSTLFTVPTILKLLAECPHIDQYDHSSLRHVIYAGAPMYEADLRLALQKFGPVLVQYYGLGEVTGNITVLPSFDHQDADGRISHPASCGYERAGMQVSIQDEQGREVAYGETGEVCVIGPAVFAGYYNNPKANAESFRNGWFRTGDIGHMDERGYVYLTGRASDMYISGGSNIYPREIEEYILLHGAITEVAVVGVPDRQWGEVGVAVCVLKEGATLTEAELSSWLSERIARYKMPKYIQFWDSLPKSGYGKVPKRMVKDELMKCLPQLAQEAPC